MKTILPDLQTFVKLLIGGTITAIVLMLIGILSYTTQKVIANEKEISNLETKYDFLVIEVQNNGRKLDEIVKSLNDFKLNVSDAIVENAILANQNTNDIKHFESELEELEDDYLKPILESVRQQPQKSQIP